MSQPARPNPFSLLLKASWEATSQERFKFYAFIFLFVLSYTIDLLVPWAIGYTIGVFVNQGLNQEAFNSAMYGIAAYMAIRLAHTFLHHYARYLQAQVAYSARMYTLNNIFGSLLKYPLNWQIESHSGDNLSKLNRSAGAIDSCIGTFVWQLIEGLVKVLFASVAIFALDFWVAVNVFTMGLVTIIIMILFNKRLTARFRDNNLFYNKIYRICIDYLFNVVTVKTLRLEPAARSYLKKQHDEGMRYTRKIAKYSELKWGTTAVGYGIVIGTSLLIYFHGRLGDSNEFDVQRVWVLIDYLNRIFQAIGSFTAYYGGIIEAATAYEDGATILERAKTIPDLPNAVTIKPDWQRIEIKDLHFQYKASETSRLRGLNFSFNRTDKIALVGPSGGGKSTLLKILGGLLVPDKVQVSSDSQSDLPIADVGMLSLLVPQEPEIFSENLRYNLTMGEPFSEEEIGYFAKLGRLEVVLDKLPAGMETDMAEKGLNISVGEKQRVAMIRGLLRARQKSILLLDEPTSSLDPKTEKEIFFSLLSHFKDRCIITACHRLNLVPLFDFIVFIRDGQVTETGNFTELLKAKGEFARAWDDYIKKTPREDLNDNTLLSDYGL
ncbi:MAG: ABC transporter ATP-binding protein [Deltaproteobacteria bacterium]|nr:ABC transporter ATP-binding protein [Deltaproteobacteria bacterium]